MVEQLNNNFVASLESCMDNITKLLAAKTSDAKLNEQALKEFRDCLLKNQNQNIVNLEFKQQPDQLREFINILANWILGNSASENLTLVCSILLMISQRLGFTHQYLLKRNITNFLQYSIDVYEEEIDFRQMSGEQFQVENKEFKDCQDQKDKSQKLLSATYASAVLSLFVSLLNKQSPIKYKQFLVILIKASSHLMVNENFKRSYRKQGAIKNMIKLIKDILTAIQNQDKLINPSETSDYIDLISYIIDFFSKFIYENKKNREYFIVKGGISLCSKFIDKNFPIFYNNDKLIKSCCSVLGNVAVSNDNKIMLWVLGSIPNLINIVKDNLSETSKSSQDQITKNFERTEYAFLAIIRRLASNLKYKEEIAKNFLYTLMTFIKIFLETQINSIDQAIDHHNKLGIAFIYKEILGCLGVLAVDETHRKEILENDGIALVIQSSKLNINKPKIIKTALGCLINFASSNESKESICQDASFYQLIYTVLDEYDQMAPMIDYTLRLILNTADNKISYQNYISGSLFTKIMGFIQLHKKNSNICWSSIQILRLLCNSDKALNKYLRSLKDVYHTEDEQKQFEQLIEQFEHLKSDTMLVSAIQKYIDKYQTNESVMQMLSNQGGAGGPPEGQDSNQIFKMIIIQTIQGKIVGQKKWSLGKRFLLLVGIFLALTTYDLSKITDPNTRQKNFYEILGLYRNATHTQIDQACHDLRQYQEDNIHLYHMNGIGTNAVYYSESQIEGIHNILTNPSLRDIYDKHLVVITKEELHERGGTIPHSQRYFMAFGVTMSYAFYFILIFFMIDKHQILAKQVSLTSLLIAIYVSVYMKMPKEGDMDNQIADYLNENRIFMNLTYHEIFQMLRIIFQNLFHLILAASRMIDVHPLEELRDKMKRFQKLSAKCQLICELIAPERPINPQDAIEQQPQQNVLLPEQSENNDTVVVQDNSQLIQDQDQQVEKSPEELQKEADEKKKQNYLEAMKYIGEKRLEQFMQTFEGIVDKKMNTAKQRSCMKKCCVFLGRLVIGLIILGAVSPFLIQIYYQIFPPTDVPTQFQNDNSFDNQQQQEHQYQQNNGHYSNYQDQHEDNQPGENNGQNQEL
eukprot:403344113